MELQTFLAVASRVPKTLHVLDVFGVSCRMQSVFEHMGYEGDSYDIKLNKAHDITSESGFKVLLEKAARQLDIYSGKMVGEGSEGQCSHKFPCYRMTFDF